MQINQPLSSWNESKLRLTLNPNKFTHKAHSAYCYKGSIIQVVRKVFTSKNHRNTIAYDNKFYQTIRFKLSINILETISNENFIEQDEARTNFPSCLYRNAWRGLHGKKWMESIAFHRWNETIEADGVWWIRPRVTRLISRANIKNDDRGLPLGRRGRCASENNEKTIDTESRSSFFLVGDWQNNYVVCTDN